MAAAEGQNATDPRKTMAPSESWSGLELRWPWWPPAGPAVPGATWAPDEDASCPIHPAAGGVMEAGAAGDTPSALEVHSRSGEFQGFAGAGGPLNQVCITL